MNDRDVMENILLTTKGVCDLYLHGSIESSTPQVHDAFTSALNEAICMQNGVYTQMESRGWYQKEQEQPQKCRQVKQKYSSAQG